MKPVLAIIIGAVIGGLVNMGLITIGPMLIPPPAGVDSSSIESLKASMHLFEAKHFIVPFLAHALGTLVGAFIAAWLAPENKLRSAMIIGAFFLIGGIAASVMLPAPNWFIALDLIAAYLPMAWLGGKLGISMGQK